MGIVQDLTGVNISALAGRTGIYRTEEFYSIVRKGLLGNSRYIKWGSVAVTGPDGSAFELLIYAPSDSTLHNLKWILKRKITAGATDEEPDTETWEFVCTTTTAKVQEVLAAHGLEKSIITGAGFATPAAPDGAIPAPVAVERTASRGRSTSNFSSWTVNVTSATQWWFGKDMSTMLAHLVFQNWAIPKAATIIKAELWAQAIGGEVYQLVIPVGATAWNATVQGMNPETFFNRISADKNRTALIADWKTGAAESSVTWKCDITAAVRDVLQQPEWIDGSGINSIAVYFLDQLETCTTRNKGISLVDGSRPILKITYLGG